MWWRDPSHVTPQYIAKRLTLPFKVRHRFQSMLAFAFKTANRTSVSIIRLQEIPDGHLIPGGKYSVERHCPDRKDLMDYSLALELDLIEGKLAKGTSGQGRKSPTQGEGVEECSSACSTGQDKEKEEAGERSEVKGPAETELKQLVEAVFDR